MIKSMTGFGRAEANVQGIKVTVEIRSVNHKYHDIMFKMPKDLLAIEDRMKKIIKNYVSRGRVDVFVTMNAEESRLQQVKVDWNLAGQYLEVIKELKNRLQVDGQIEVKDFLTFPDLIQIGEGIEDPEQLAPDLLHIVEAACQNLMDMRLAEGNHLYHDLTSRTESLIQLVHNLKDRAPYVIEEYRQKLKSRISEWLEGLAEVDEARLLNEVAFFADKASIDEELTRLNSHFQQFLIILDQEEPVGRKLDFLIQEMNRETNTIGSKANDLSLSQMVVEMKSELEKMREQVQNIE